MKKVIAFAAAIIAVTGAITFTAGDGDVPQVPRGYCWSIDWQREDGLNYTYRTAGVDDNGRWQGCERI